MSEENTQKEYQGLVFVAKPKLTHKDKKSLNKLVAKAFKQKEGEEVKKTEGSNILDRLNFKEIPEILEIQIDAGEVLKEELVKAHWNTPNFWETAGQQDNYWDTHQMDDIDGDDYDEILYPPCEEANILKLKKN